MQSSRRSSWKVYLLLATMLAGLPRAKGQLISECLFGILNFPKNQRKIWQISAQESKKWSNHKIKAPYSVFKTLNSPYNHSIKESAFALLIWPLFSAWAEICQIFRWFFGKFKNIKNTFWNYLTFTPLRWHILHYKRWKKSTFLDLPKYPPLLVNVVWEHLLT